MHLHIASLFTEGLQKILRIEAESCDSILHIQRSCQVRHCTIIVLAQIWSCTFAIVMHAILGYTETRLSLEPCLLFQERLGLQQSSLNELRLVYNGKTLNSRKTLTDYGIQNQSTVQLAPRLRWLFPSPSRYSTWIRDQPLYVNHSILTLLKDND